MLRNYLLPILIAVVPLQASAALGMEMQMQLNKNLYSIAEDQNFSLPCHQTAEISSNESQQSMLDVNNICHACALCMALGLEFNVNTVVIPEFFSRNLFELQKNTASPFLAALNKPPIS